MPQYTITTLSPLHIGSGNLISANFEYLHFKEERYVAVIDEAKVLEIIGPENLAHWVNVIENGEDLLRYLRTQKPGLTPEMVASRILAISKDTRLTNTNGELLPMREHFHTARKPCLPGSSLKGSMRTEALADALYARYPKRGMSNKKIGLGKERINRSSNRGFYEFDDAGITRELLGNDPNSNVMRLLRPGDATFSATEVQLGVFANRIGNQWKIDPRQQLLECVPAGQSATVSITQPKELMKLLERPTMPLKNPFEPTPRAYTHVRNLNDFFTACHEHTLRLLDLELGFWLDEEDTRYDTTAVETYRQALDTLYEEARNFDKNTYLLRIGFGSGLKGMTGDWQYDLFDSDTYEDWLTLLDRRDVGIYPKTRKMTGGKLPLGFVKVEAI